MRLWKCFVEVMSLHLPTSSRVITARATSGSITPKPSSAIKNSLAYYVRGHQRNTCLIPEAHHTCALRSPRLSTALPGLG